MPNATQLIGERAKILNPKGLEEREMIGTGERRERKKGREGKELEMSLCYFESLRFGGCLLLQQILAYPD